MEINIFHWYALESINPKRDLLSTHMQIRTQIFLLTPEKRFKRVNLKTKWGIFLPILVIFGIRW